MQCELKTAKLFTNVHYASTVFRSSPRECYIICCITLW